MMTKHQFLLLQARNPGDPMREHEAQCVADTLGLDRASLFTHEISDTIPSYTEVRKHDALILGGSAAHYISGSTLPTEAAYFELLREVVEIGHPTFAICYGFQALCAAHGAEVVSDPSRAEFGSFECIAKPETQDDALFKCLPETFWVQHGHSDHVQKAPEGWVHLCTSNQSAVQAVRVPTKPIWGVQFHPELTLEQNRRRYQAYMSKQGSEDSGETVWNESPYATQLFAQFRKTVLP